jgi:uncharacterized protein (TIGR03083 family)
MRPLEARYDETRQRVVDLMHDVTDGASATVPACPGWSVRDVLAHVTGVCADVLGGNLDGAATDDWTRAQVEARRQVALPELLAEWDHVAPPFAAMLDDFPDPYSDQVVADLTIHEQDIRGALGRAGARDSAAVANSLAFLLRVFAEPAARDRGLRPLRDAVTTTSYELFRALTGRRSAAQIRSWDWQVDPADYLPLFGLGPFTVRHDDLVE